MTTDPSEHITSAGPSENIEIRAPRTPADYQAYYAFRWEILRKPHYKSKGSEKDENEASAHHLMAQTDAGDIVGVGRIHIREDGIAQVRYMAVHPEFERRGLGRKILNALETQICSIHRSCTIELNSRDTAVPFYEKCGYTVQAPGHRLFGIIPHTVMNKTIHC
ncbi:MAG: GNAT family N-acetyltransferase [Verrucomicrobiota bacterium]